MIENNNKEPNSKVEKKVEKRRGRKPGTAKTGGRKRGTKNRNSFAFRQSLDESGFNLAEELIAQYEKTRDTEKKVSILFRMASYIYPTLTESPYKELPKTDPLEKAGESAKGSSVLGLIKKNAMK